MGCPAATLVDLGPTNNWPHMVDSTVVRAHSQAAGAEIKLIRRLLVDHAVDFTSKIHARYDTQGRPLGFVLTGGQVSDYEATDTLMKPPFPEPQNHAGRRGL